MCTCTSHQGLLACPLLLGTQAGAQAAVTFPFGQLHCARCARCHATIATAAVGPEQTDHCRRRGYDGGNAGHQRSGELLPQVISASVHMQVQRAAEGLPRQARQRVHHAWQS